MNGLERLKWFYVDFAIAARSVFAAAYEEIALFTCLSMQIATEARNSCPRHNGATRQV